jgi:tetratricopeptide (TPR) repeat protein
MRNRLAILTALASLAGLVGCQGLSEQQRRWLDGGEQAYGQGDHGRAIDQLTRFVSSAGDKPEVSRALYVRALARAQTNQRALVSLATIDYEDRQWAAAARSYSAAAELAPRQPPIDVALLRLGLCCERMGRWGEAQAAFGRVAADFPESNVAAAARRRLQLKAESFAVQCGVFLSQDNAQRLASELKQAGLPAYIRTESRDTGRVHIVLVGHYASYDEATTELARVRGRVPEAVLWP